MEDLEFECDAVGCLTKVGRKDGLCKYHIGRYLEARKNGGPAFLRKSQGHGTPLTPALSLKGRGRKRTAEETEAEMKCSRCGKSSAGGKRFSKKKGLCNSCVATIYQYKKAGKEVPPVKGKTKETSASGGGTASLKEGKIYAAELKCKDCGRNKSEVKKFNKRTEQCFRCYQRDWAAGKKAEKKPLTPALSLKERGRKKAETPQPLALSLSKGRGKRKATAAGEQISPGLPLKKEGKWEAEGILTLTLDFTGHESLLEVIMSTARDDLRTPDMQALFMIKEVLDK